MVPILPDLNTQLSGVCRLHLRISTAFYRLGSGLDCAVGNLLNTGGSDIQYSISLDLLKP